MTIRFRPSLLALLLVLSILSPSAVHAASELQARALLDSVAATYRALTDYHLIGSTHVAVTSASFNNSVSVAMQFAGRQPGQLHTEVRNPYFPSLVISDGDTTWTYAANLHQFTASATALAPSSEGNADEQRAITPLKQYERVNQRVKRVNWIGPDTLEMRDGVANVVRLEVESIPDSAAENITRWPHLLWIDPARRIVLRDSTRTDVMNSQMGQVTTLEDLRFTYAQIGAGVPDSLFSFRAPDDARRVEEIGAPGMKRNDLTGKSAADFSLATLDGKNVKLSSLKGQIVLLDFWATWCGPCRAEMPTIVKLHRELGPKGLRVFAVNVAEEPEKVRAFLKKNNYDLPVLLDRQRVASAAYSADAIPTLAVIGKDGKIAKYMVGGRSEAELRAALKLAGLPD